MKVDRVDVCHETIQEETDESLVVSVTNINKGKRNINDEEDDFQYRFNLNYHDEVSPLIQACVGEMNNTEEVKDFFLKNQR